MEEHLVEDSAVRNGTVLSYNVEVMAPELMLDTIMGLSSPASMQVQFKKTGAVVLPELL